MRAEPNTKPSIPLRESRLKRFKSVSDEEIELSPLTILVGPNSSGKSSLLQSILLMVQAAQSIEGGENFSLNGSLVSLGGYAEVVSALQRRSSGFEIGGKLALGSDASVDGRRRLGLASEGPVDNFVVDWDVGFRGTPEHEPGSTIVQKVSLATGGDVADSLRLRMQRVRPSDVQRSFDKFHASNLNVVSDFWALAPVSVLTSRARSRLLDALTSSVLVSSFVVQCLQECWSRLMPIL